MSNESAIINLLHGIEFKDSREHDLLQLLLSDFYKLYYESHPPTGRSSFGVTGQSATLSDVTGFTLTTFGNNLKLSWTRIAVLAMYEIRMNIGTSTTWDGADIQLRTATTSADLNPLTIPLVYGTYTFLIKAFNAAGTESANAVSAVLVVPQIPAPVITANVIGNIAVLNWTTPASTWNISHYKVYQNGTLLGTTNSTFASAVVGVEGTYTFKVIAVDIVGNESADSSELELEVGNPPDFTQFDSIVSTFTGTKTNCMSETVDGVLKLLATIDLTQTHEDHFDDEGWTDIQDKLDDPGNYTLYIQPVPTTGSYEETFDFGEILTNVMVNVTFNLEALAGAIDMSASTIEFSDDNISYSSPLSGFSNFVASCRYIRLTLDFVSDGVDLQYLFNLTVSRSVKRENDGGAVSVLAADSGGTTVEFGKNFKLVESIVVTPKGTAGDQIAEYDFDHTTEDPTEFKILLFDAAGNRINGDVSWAARGVM